MPRNPLRTFRPVWVAGVTAIVVGGAGAAFAFGPLGGSSSPAAISLASRSSFGAHPSPTGTPTARPTSPGVRPVGAPGHKKKSEHHKAHGHGHGIGRGWPTVHPTAPSPAPTKPTTAPTTPAAPPTTTPPSSGGTKTEQYQNEVIRLVNVERAKVGCGALKYNADLTKAAQDHAVDMLTHNYFSHDSQDGTNPFDRMTAAGYHWSGAAENIAAGQATPADVMNSWMNSEGHRANILNCGLKDIGVGYAAGPGADYGQYWVQDFGSPL